MKFSLSYADSDGAETYNLELSKRRVMSVSEKLLDNGLNADKFNISFNGETSPLDDNSTDVVKANNRVVTVKFTL